MVFYVLPLFNIAIAKIIASKKDHKRDVSILQRENQNQPSHLIIQVILFPFDYICTKSRVGISKMNKPSMT